MMVVRSRLFAILSVCASVAAVAIDVSADTIGTIVANQSEDLSSLISVNNMFSESDLLESGLADERPAIKAPIGSAINQYSDTDSFGVPIIEPITTLPPDAVRQTVVHAISACRPVTEKRDYHVLPDGLLWHSYLAGPQEPRISAILFGDDKGGYFWDATLGGRIGFLRYGTEDAKNPKGWQWDLEGAAITRLDLLESEDVESVDYRFGTQMTWAEGSWAMKFGYFHLSSHVGDEYLIRNPTFQRINYVTEALVWAVSNQPVEPVRVYGEITYAVKEGGGALRWQYQTGMEWTPPPPRPGKIAPFAAVNLGFRESTEYHMATTIQTGWGYQGPKSDRRLRFGLQYGDGPTSQFSFVTRTDEYLGWGIWFDY
jgi:hypothetical protein